MSGEGRAQEVSAGGIVIRQDQLLLVKVKNLKGEVVWTFPKGHLEGKESPEEAALREVQEETGWRCELKEPFCDARYSFEREGRPVDKVVFWFLMDPLTQVGKHDPQEIMESGWCSWQEAAERLSYPSDLQIMKDLKREKKSES